MSEVPPDHAAIVRARRLALRRQMYTPTVRWWKLLLVVDDLADAIEELAWLAQNAKDETRVLAEHGAWHRAKERLKELQDEARSRAKKRKPRDGAPGTWPKSRTGV